MLGKFLQFYADSHVFQHVAVGSDLDFHWKYEDLAKRYVTVPARGRCRSSPLAFALPR